MKSTRWTEPHNEKEFDYPRVLDALKPLPAHRMVLDGEIAALDEKSRSSSGCDPTKRQRRSFVSKSHRSLQANARLLAPKVARKLLSPPMKHYAVSHKKAQEGF